MEPKEKKVENSSLVYFSTVNLHSLTNGAGNGYPHAKK